VNLKKSRVPHWYHCTVTSKTGHWLGFHFHSREQLLSPFSSTKSFVRQENPSDDVNGNHNDSENKMFIHNHYIKNRKSSVLLLIKFTLCYSYACCINSFSIENH
jgi:hypothetical protein